MNYSKPLFLFCCLSILINGSAQVDYARKSIPIINSPAPVSPNAASLGKYGETPVGYYTGIPNIGLPLYDIQSGSLKMPVSLSYHAGGVKVEDIASWVGLGWNLNAGGTITRQVRGIPDELPTAGFLASYGKIDSFINSTLSSTDRTNYMAALKEGSMDSQQDMFSYNFGGESGKFVFMPGREVSTIPLTKNRFEFGTFLGQDSSWKVTGNDGTVYYFTALEITHAGPANGVIPGNLVHNITSWYLTKMVNALGTDTLSIEYDGTSTQFKTSNVQTRYEPDYYNNPGDHKDIDDDYSNVAINGFVISQINFRNGSVKFYTNHASTREDFYLDKPLDSIVITNSDNSFYKKYLLYQSYISSSTSLKSSDDYEEKRMFLDSVAVYDASGRVNAYVFAYDQSAQLPPRNSYDQDYWGYYNGANNGAYFAPPIYNSTVLTEGADRRSSPDLCKLGILKSIYYPTGGHTDFDYEINRVINLPGAMDLGGGIGHQGFQESSSFSITDNVGGSGGVQATLSIGGGCTSGCPTIYLTTPVGSYSISSNVQMFLPVGSYYVAITPVADSTIMDNFSFNVTYTRSAFSDTNFAYNAPAGGVRIKKITNYSANNVKSDVKTYTYKNPVYPSRSSGYLAESNFGYVNPIEIRDTYGLLRGYITVSSGSNYPMLSTQGTCVGYNCVQEYLGENGEFGKNEYVFTAPDSYPDEPYTTFPYSPAKIKDWKRGRLSSSKSYRYNTTSATYELVSENTNFYTDNEEELYHGIKAGANQFYPFSYPLTSNLETQPYSNVTGWFPPNQQSTRVYDQNNTANYIETTKNLYYGSNHYEPVELRTTNSKGDLVKTFMKYPLDYSSLTGSDAFTAGIKNLQDKNITSPVIEKYTQIGSDNRTTQATITSYKATTPLADIIYTTELAGAITSFSPTSVSGGSILSSTLYQPQVSLNKYDFYGNIIEQQKLKDAKHTYLWDYLAAYPIAEVSNADSASVAYTSFEADGTGNWSGISSGSVVVLNANSPTGNKYYTLTGSTLQKTGLNSGDTSVVSYWSSTGTNYTVSGTLGSPKTGATINGWTYIEHQVTGSSTVSVSGTGAIDELRLYPKGALMTTYTYLPLSGMTSQCDAGNRIIYYEYDSLGRLLLVKDEKRKILKTFDYRYK